MPERNKASCADVILLYLVEDNVAVFGVNLLTYSLPGRLEPCDVGEVADVDAAVGAAEQSLPLHPGHRLILHPQTFEPRHWVQLRRTEVQEIVLQSPSSSDLTIPMMVMIGPVSWQLTAEYSPSPQHQQNLKKINY